jgi:hypothetical protein
MPFCGANRETTIPSNYVEFDWVCGGVYGNQDADTAPFNAGEINTRISDDNNFHQVMQRHHK